MSAIGAVVFLDGRPATGQMLESMGRALGSLGDRSDFLVAGPAGLLHRPMAFTPEDEHERQPLVGGEGRFVLVFDGRIDNREEFTAAWGETPGPLPVPDSRYVLRAWEAWGEVAPQRLIGSWAFIVWDVVERSLFAAVSPSDGRTLYYHHGAGSFAAATMPRGLFVLPGVDRALDELKIADFLLDVVDLSRSFFVGVTLLPPGHRLRLGNGTIDVRRFWSVEEVRPVRFRRDEEYVEAACALLDRVVAAQLRSRSRVSLFLSGGLDSSAVAATAAPLLASRGERLLAFTEVPRISFPGPVPPGRYADETPLVTAIARRHPAIDLTLVRTGSRSFLDDLEILFDHLEAPFRNVFNRCWMEAIAAEARQRGSSVLLTGSGGNMTMSWEGHDLFSRLLREGRWPRAFREAQALAGGDLSAARLLVSQGLLPLLPGGVGPVARRAWGLLARHCEDGLDWSPIRPEFAGACRVAERARSLSQRRVDRSRMGPAEGRAWLLGLGSGRAADTAFRSLHGVDLRSPLFDVRLVEFTLGIPEEQHVRNGCSRWLVRRAMEGRLPREVLENRERGLQAADWFEGLTSARDQLTGELERFGQDDLASRALDLPRCLRAVARWPDEEWPSPRVMADYWALGKAVMTGRFILWARGLSPAGGRREGA